MTLNKKYLKTNYFSPILLNLSIYLFLSSIIYYLFSLNVTLVKLGLLFSLFILVFCLSSKNTEFIMQKVQLKEVFIISKFLLGIITFSAGLLIHNNSSLDSVSLYFLVLTTAILYDILIKAYNKYDQKFKKNNKPGRNNKIIFYSNLEKIIIVILAAVTTVLIEINLIPLILLGTAVYYFISAYINTFQEI